MFITGKCNGHMSAWNLENFRPYFRKNKFHSNMHEDKIHQFIITFTFIIKLLLLYIQQSNEMYLLSLIRGLVKT